MFWKTGKATPKTIGNYDILDKIAVGGTGTVYRGRHWESGQVVAIKVLASDLAAQGSVQKRFRQEYLAASRLNHPNIVRALQFGQEGPLFYLVMDLVDGQSLYDLIERTGPLKEKDAVGIILQVADALAVAHEQGIIHRDVKPDNILVTGDGKALLTDLGLAKDQSNDLNITRSCSGLGTPNFMAPEQFRDAKGVGPRCDIYSLGATLYMAVTGKIPFEARGVVQVLEKKLRHDFTPPSQLANRLSESTERVIVQSMNADPERRPCSCREFIARLEPVVRLAPALAASPSARGERRRAARHPSNLEGFCQVLEGATDFRWLVETQDVSTTGIGLLVNRSFEPGALLNVELYTTGLESPRTLLAQVARNKAYCAGKWLLGCVLVTSLAEDQARDLR